MGARRHGEPDHALHGLEGSRRIASGELAHVALKTKEVIDRGEQAPVLIFDDVTGEQIEVDFRGTAEEVLKRLAKVRRAGPARAGRGSAAWPWASEAGRRRPRGHPAAAALGLAERSARGRIRRAAQACGRGEARERRQGSRPTSQEAAYRFMSAMAGNFPGFEEATRAFFAGDRGRFDELVEPWPADVRDHARTLAAISFQGEPGRHATNPPAGSPGSQTGGKFRDNQPEMSGK